VNWSDRTDKMTNGYVPTYLRLSGKIGVRGRICEVGVAGGGSLEFWQSLFPLGVVVGVDQDPNAVWPEGTFRVVAEQTDPTLPKLLETKSRDGCYDLIVDDASHDGTKTAETFRLLWPLVAPGRWYVIEDWGVAFPGRAPSYDAKMRYTAMNLIETLDPAQGWGVQEIRYRDGLIIIERN